jgi:hypothetical protein
MQIMGRIAIATNKILQIRQLLLKPLIILLQRYDSAKTSIAAQTISNCINLFCS